MEVPRERTPAAELPARLEELARALRASEWVVAARAEELAALADRAIERARALESAFALALDAAEQARAALAKAGTAPEAPRAEPATEPSARRVEPLPEPAPAPADGSLETARLVAIEMAVAGRDRDEVGRHLRSAFELPDTDALLDDVFGEPSRRRAGSL